MSNDLLVLDRRTFLHRVSAAAVVLPLAGLATVEFTGCSAAGALPASGSNAWRTTFCAKDEPGEPMIISGTVFAPDGRTKLEGITLFAYQTDNTGRYTPQAGRDNRTTRLHGSMITNADGQYGFRTIKPAPYPEGKIPAHVHAYVSGPGYPEYWIDEYLFAGDPLIDPKVRDRELAKGTFSAVVKLTKDGDGVLRGVRDIQVERCSKTCTGK